MRRSRTRTDLELQSTENTEFVNTISAGTDGEGRGEKSTASILLVATPQRSHTDDSIEDSSLKK